MGSPRAHNALPKGRVGSIPTPTTKIGAYIIEEDRIRFLAKSQGGSEHILIGKVKDKDVVPFVNIKEGIEHLRSNGWKEIRHAVDRSWNEDKGAWRIKWDDQRVTFNEEGSVNFWYEVKT